MTTPVMQRRARPGTIVLGVDREPVITIRVEVPEVWDVVRIQTPPTASVAAIKQRALESLVPDATDSDDWVTKLGGFEVLDENAALADAGVKNGSTLLVMGRHRKPVR